MTGLRHVVKRAVHKERHQLASRKKLGILEKKKDFQKRAKHIHKKRDLLDSLKQKAFLRNPEEFAYGMINAKKNSAGEIDLGVEKSKNAHAVRARPDKDTRSCVLEPRTDGKGKVQKFRFERKR